MCISYCLFWQFRFFNKWAKNLLSPFPPHSPLLSVTLCPTTSFTFAPSLPFSLLLSLSKALMDLLVELCSRHHLNPALHTLELLSSEGHPLGFKPNALLGSLNVACVFIKEKGREEKVVSRPAPRVPEVSEALFQIGFPFFHKSFVYAINACHTTLKDQIKYCKVLFAETWIFMFILPNRDSFVNWLE